MRQKVEWKPGATQNISNSIRNNNKKGNIFGKINMMQDCCINFACKSDMALYLEHIRSKLKNNLQ